jgi:methylmalonyl-CoA mutase N-terminal domain/subunit
MANSRTRTSIAATRLAPARCRLAAPSWTWAAPETGGPAGAPAGSAGHPGTSRWSPRASGGRILQRIATKPEHKPSIAPVVGPDDPRRFTDSGIEIKTAYDEGDVAPGLEERLGEPGEYPFARGIHPEMYRSRKWTMRQYAGYAAAKETNERFRYLIEHGSTGLSMAFDLPTQLGRDSDDPLCAGEVGRTGVAIDSIDDIRSVFDQIPLDEVSTSMTINAPAAVLLLLYELVGEEQGVPSEKLRGTTQNDILKEYIARGNFIYPPEPAMRLTTDLFAYCRENVPKWNTISISGYHMREKGCSAVQEVGFTLANAIAYVQAAIDAGLDVDEFGPRLAFFFNGHNNVFQEVAKFRAARRMWARIMKERFGAQDERSMKIRFHTQTGGVTLAAQQPHNNIVRVALQGFAAVCGGTQSLHTNGFDEALALPSETAARIALRTQQILAHESGAADSVDPFAGSYFVESLTDEIEEAAQALIDKVEELGGSVNCIPFIRAEVEESAWGYEERYKQKQDIVVGVNEYVTDQIDDVEILKIDPKTEENQVERLEAFKADRDQDEVKARLEELRAACAGSDNLLVPMRAALKARASLGEVCGVMRDEFGEYSEA